MFPVFPIRHFDFSSRKLFCASFENRRNLREREKDDFLSLSFFLVYFSFSLLQLFAVCTAQRTVRFRRLFTFNNSRRNRIPILNIHPCSSLIAKIRSSMYEIEFPIQFFLQHAISRAVYFFFIRDVPHIFYA